MAGCGTRVVPLRYTHPVRTYPYVGVTGQHEGYTGPGHRGTCTYDRFGHAVGEPRGIRTHIGFRVPGWFMSQGGFTRPFDWVLPPFDRIYPYLPVFDRISPSFTRIYPYLPVFHPHLAVVGPCCKVQMRNWPGVLAKGVSGPSPRVYKPSTLRHFDNKVRPEVEKGPLIPCERRLENMEI